MADISHEHRVLLEYIYFQIFTHLLVNV